MEVWVDFLCNCGMEHTCPLVGSISPTSMLINVLFPAPLGPNKPRISPEKGQHKHCPRDQISGSKSCFYKSNSSTANNWTPTFLHTQGNVFGCHFLYFSPQKKFLPFIKLFVQAADQDCWHLAGKREVAADPSSSGEPQTWGLGFTSSLLGLLRISLTLSLSAFTSSSSFSSWGTSGNFQGLALVKHFLKGREAACDRAHRGLQDEEERRMLTPWSEGLIYYSIIYIIHYNYTNEKKKEKISSEAG